MLRTIILRNELLKETLKNAARIKTVRTLSIESTRRRHKNNQPSLLKTTNKIQWKYNAVRFYADLPAHKRLSLPALSPTMESGTIISWEKKEGDKLNEGNLLAEIETNKVTMGFDAPEEGYLAKILVPGGTKNVPIGKLVCIIVTNQADVAAFKDFKDDGSAAPAAAPDPAAPPTPSVSAPAGEGGRVYASPMAKRLAAQRQIRLQGKGTGLFDSITSRDLPAADAGPAPAPAAFGARLPKT